MARTISVSEARAALPEILDRVEAGEEVTITRHGRPAAVVVRPDALRVRRADQALAAAERLQDIITGGGKRPLPEAGLDPARADELLADLATARTRG